MNSKVDVDTPNKVRKQMRSLLKTKPSTYNIGRHGHTNRGGLAAVFFHLVLNAVLLETTMGLSCR